MNKSIVEASSVLYPPCSVLVPMLVLDLMLLLNVMLDRVTNDCLSFYS